MRYLLLIATFLLASCSDRNMETLNQIRGAKPGLPASNLTQIFHKDKPDYDFSVDSTPPWIDEVISEHPKDGRYFVYLVSGTRLVIVYVTSQSKIGFVTWTNT